VGSLGAGRRQQLPRERDRTLALTQTAEFHIHADLRGWIITALDEHFIDWGDYRVDTSGELSGGVPVPRR